MFKLKKRSLQYINQSSQSLRYLFIPKFINIQNDFNIVKQKKINLNFGKLILSIVGESHIIQFEYDNIKLTEILANVKSRPLLQASEKKFSLKDIKEKTKYKYQNNYFSYYFSVKKENIDYFDAKNLLSKLKRYNSSNLIFYEWANKNQREQISSILPFTSIEYKLFNSYSIGIDTLHFYEEEYTLITTHSDLKLL